MRFQLAAILTVSSAFIAAGACTGSDGPAGPGGGGSSADGGAVGGSPDAGAQPDQPDARDSSPALPEPEARYHDYGEVEAFVKLVAARNPDRVAFQVYGTSGEGRSIYVVKISDDVGSIDSDDPNEPNILINFSIHGDEIITVESGLKLLHALTETYGTDDRVANLVNNYEIFVVPVVSPDSFTARSRYVGRVDPNRNFPWDANPNRQSIDVVAAARALYEAHDFAGTLDYHAFGEWVLLPYGGKFEQPANFADIEAVGKLLGQVDGYVVEQISTLFGQVQNGGSLDYYHWKSGGNTINIGIELTTSKSPPDSSIPAVAATAQEIAFRFIEQF